MQSWVTPVQNRTGESLRCISYCFLQQLANAGNIWPHTCCFSSLFPPESDSVYSEENLYYRGDSIVKFEQHGKLNPVADGDYS
jgi:hypothetical protein